VNADRLQASDGDGPKKITIALPFLIGFAAWFWRILAVEPLDFEIRMRLKWCRQLQWRNLLLNH